MNQTTNKSTDNRQQCAHTAYGTDGNFLGVIIVIMAFTPFPRIYPAGIYKSNDYPYSGDSGISFDGTK
mgnify:CR=1 FL=1